MSISSFLRASIGACALAFVGLATACPAFADPEPPAPPGPLEVAPAAPAPQWPEALRNRNARRAVLTRAQDLEGDDHERVIAESYLDRVQDPIGDREEARRARGARARPPRASRFAEIARADDRDGDARQLALSQLTVERRHAEIRRYRDLSGDRDVLDVYLAERAHDDGVGLGGEGTSAHSEDRDDTSRVRQNETDSGAEQRIERNDDRRRDREINRSEAATDRYLQRIVDHTADRAEDRAADDATDDADRAAEHKQEREVDRTAEKADERKVERKDERAADRRDERQLQREEQKPGAPGASAAN